MIVLLLFFSILLLIMFPYIENFDYQHNLIQAANNNICKPGYTLIDCKQTTPKITTTLDTISTVCKCVNDNISYNVDYNSESRI